MKQKKKTILITGGSEGIGAQFAEAFSKEGHNLILVARNYIKLNEVKVRLENQYHNRIRIISFDLSKEGSAQKLYDEINEIKIDILINNAGFGMVGESWKQSIEKDERMVQLNISSMMSLMKLILKDMIERDEGIIVNVGSLGGFQPGPYIATYYATKSFVLQYTKAVAKEIKNTSVRIHCLAPGPVRTSFHTKANDYISRFSISTERCVKYTLDYLGTRKVVLIPGFIMRLSLFLPEGIRMYFIEKQKKKAL